MKGQHQSAPLDGLVVGSAGNNSTSSTNIEYLASREDCLGVAWLEPDGSKAPQSNYGTWVDIHRVS